ncbi:MAG: lipase maturation factor family protein [Spartobacteria bacterium]
MNVAHPPAKPLMIWDGDCHFCRHWIERWCVITAGEVDYETSQNVAERFPEISREQFQRAVVFIDTNGEVFVAAAAVCRSLTCRSSRKWLWWSYNHIPGFAAISEFGYKIVARHRGIGSALTRWLWGNDVRPPTYFWAGRWFLRGLGLVYLVAFVSLWTQIDGLIGANGILPIADYLTAARERLGAHAMSILPTLCWFNSSNAFLHFLCGGGVLFSLLLIVGIAPAISAFAFFVFYLSLSIAGQTFLSFQWDILLLEAGFLSIFLAPWQLWPSRGSEQPVSKVALFLLKFLLFKLMLMSGVVKLTSGDDCWWNLTALDFHYWSQPLPTICGWWFDQDAEWFKKFSVAFCLVVEIIVPFFIWAPRRPRLIAAGLLIFLQLAIALTGNYCFFNLLTIALCLLLIDDAAIGYATEFRRAKRLQERLSIFAGIAVLVITLPLNAWLIYGAFKPEAEMPRPMQWVYGHVEPFRIANGYGLFRVMTKDRREIVIEGSADGIEWKPYEFKWKPGDVNRVPGWCAPHQPRLDWQMWFAALSEPRQNRWLMRTIVCLIENKRDVTRLFARNPFPDSPPQYLRARFFRYRFANAEEHRQSGAWWKREELREYLPTISADQLR